MSSLLWDEFRSLLARYLAVDIERITPQTHLATELGLDALDLVLLSVRIEEQAELEMPIAAIARVQTVADFVNSFQPTRPPSSSVQSSERERERAHESWTSIRVVRSRDRMRSTGF